MKRAFLLIGGLALLVAGCGGSSRLSRSEYAAKENAICAKYAKDISALKTPASLSGLGDFAARAKSIAGKAIAEAARLKPPKDEQATADQWNAANQDVLNAIGKLATAAKAGDQAGAKAALDAGQAANKRSNGFARQLGLDTCAKA